MSHIPSEVIDDLMEIYCEWREECIWLGTAYERWREVPAEGPRPRVRRLSSRIGP